MTIAILATGDELIQGDTLNTNAHEIAHTLSSENLPIGFQLACRDDVKEILQCLHFLTLQHNIIIVIGGLGPTTDDLTRFALEQFTGEPLIQHEEALKHIKHRLQAGNVPLNQGNVQQSLFPEQAHLLPNPNGTALGCCYYWNNKTLILLPGPPRECLPMFNNHVLPVLRKTEHSTKQLLKWRVFGLAESEMAHTLENALTHIDCQTGYRLESPYIEFKVSCSYDLIDVVKQIVDPILAPHIIATPDQKASDKLRELIIQMNTPITIIDNATGGLLETLLIKPGVHHLINFNGAVNNKLSFTLSGLEEFWSKQVTKGQTQVIIHYRNQKQEGGETHLIPYRSPLVVNHAAEWLSFRLFHLINQLH
ncbi:MAG: competence/damage-inducible protein A [bacterium]|nr:competence/damage-inducible protein A [bacterium]